MRKGVNRRSATGVAVGMVALALGLTGVSISPAAAPAPPAPLTRTTGPDTSGTLYHMPPGTLVDPQHLPPAAPGRPALRLPPEHRLPPARGSAPGPGSADSSGAVRATTASATVSSPQAAASPSTSLSLSPDFAAMSYARQQSSLGIRTDPPDTAMAVGPNHVVEAVNPSLSIWTKGGSQVGSTIDLDSFFTVPLNDEFSDPRVLYDAPSGRFFLSGMAFDPNTLASVVYLAVSTSSDPTQGWWKHLVPTNSATVLHDQPRLGLSDDKVVMAWDDFTTTSFLGAEWTVMQKSDALGGGGVGAFKFGPYSTHNPVLPVQSLSSTATEFMVENTETKVSVAAVTGTPNQNSVAISYTTVTLPAATSAPPNAPQPSTASVPSPPALDTADDRMLTAVWQNGAVWASANTSCQSNGHSCGHLFQLATAGSGCPCLLQSLDVSRWGGDVYYPAVALDPAGNLYYTATSSSSTQFASIVAGFQPAGSTAAPNPSVTLANGVIPHTKLDTTDPNPGARWGDYAAAAVDPTQTSNVWVAGEAMTDSASSLDWVTYIGRVTIPGTAPTALAAVVGSDNSVFSKAVSGNYQSLGGRASAAPAVVAVPSAGGNVPLFITVAPDHSLQVASPTLTWQPLVQGTGFACYDSPGATVTPAVGGGGYTLTVACEGADTALWYAQTPVTSTTLPVITTGFTSLGGSLSAGPAVASVNGVITFFVDGSNRQLFTRTISNFYVGQAAACVGHPAVSALGSAAFIACHGTDDQLYYSMSTQSGWGAFHPAGGVLVNGPGIALLSGGATIFVEGTDQSMFHILISPTGAISSAWTPDGGILQFGAGAGAV